ncbi:SseB family protein [Nocardioides sp.]|uniref:SseB family protein n=1 Tax=Nocardioides sp. TaxID=35761 RepID=UPI003784386E
MTEPGAEPRAIPDPGFAEDDGSAPPEVSRALAGWVAGSTTYAGALGTLQRSRVLVPVVAVLGELEEGGPGPAREKTSEMVTPLLHGADGRQALLAFTSTQALSVWNPEARPVPVATPEAARSALEAGAAALVVDIAGPVRFVVEGEDLLGLAEGWSLARVGGQSAWIRPMAE